MQAGSKVSNFEQIHDRNTGKEWGHAGWISIRHL
jgi:hypothetical protein